MEKAGSNTISIALVGPECSGKTTLSAQLAEKFSAELVEEYARTYLEQTNGDYTISALDEIAKGQFRLQQEAQQSSNAFAVFDTELLTIKIWSDVKFGMVSSDIESMLRDQQVDLFLLCRPDLKWAFDPLREAPEEIDRINIFKLYEAALNAMKANYKIVQGEGEVRAQLAIEFVEDLLQNFS